MREGSRSVGGNGEVRYAYSKTLGMRIMKVGSGDSRWVLLMGRMVNLVLTVEKRRGR